MGTAQTTGLNTDLDNKRTSSEYGDAGDGVDRWHQWHRVADGGDAAIGSTTDAAETDTAAAATVVALLKGIIDTQPGTPSTAAATALSSSLVVKATPGTLRTVVGYSTTAQFLQVHDADALPADGVAPLAVIPIDAGAPFSLAFGELGLPCSAGIVVVVSTTGPTKTLGAADTFVTAVYE